jgi:RNA polymerase sigma-70 factor (ECF subfamily)
VYSESPKARSEIGASGEFWLTAHDTPSASPKQAGDAGEGVACLVGLDGAAPESELSIERKWLGLARVNRSKFFYFYEKYYPRILKYLYWKSRDLDLAEELTSLTFFRAITCLWQYRWRGVSFGAWLYRIALNELGKHVREARRCPVTPSNVLELRPCPRPSLLSEVMASEEKTQVWDCVQRLDALDQDVIILHYWEGQTLREIAIVLGKPVGTIKARLKRAREKLRVLLVGEFSLVEA